jgi:hypothetical protein
MLVRKQRIEEAPLQNELMLFDPDSSKFYVLNPTMAFVWRRCEEQSADDIAAALENEFAGVARSQASSDVHSAVSELVNLGLVHLRENISA